MNKLKALILSLTCATTATAQSYDELWKQIEQARAKDLPKTALQHVMSVEQKAQAEGNAAQELKAQLMMGIYLNEISPDSVAPYMEELEEKLKQEKRPVVGALYHAALAQLYNSQLQKMNVTDEDLKRQKLSEHFAASLADSEALAKETTSSWLPLFDEGEKSQAFGYDLLHTLYYSGARLDEISATERQAQRDRLHNFYRQKGNREALVLFALEEWQETYGQNDVDGALEDEAGFKELLELAREYADVPACIFVYDELLQWHNYCDTDQFEIAKHNDSLLYELAQEALRRYGEKDVYKCANKVRNVLSRLTLPSVSLRGVNHEYYPAAKDTFRVEMRACTRAELKLYLLTESAAKYDQLVEKGDEGHVISRLTRNKQAIVTQTITTPQAEAWKWKQTTVDIQLPTQPGIYLARLTNQEGMQRQMTFRVTANHALLFKLPNGDSRLRVVDEQTGAVKKDAIVTIYTREYKTIKRLRPDAQGCFVLPTSNWEYGMNAYFTTPNDAAGDELSLYKQSGYQSQKQKTQSNIDLFTDRAIYRPGQKVYFSATAYESVGDDYGIKAGLKGEVTLFDANDKKVDSLKVCTDEWGTLKGEFQLPESCLPGRFYLQFKGGAFRMTHTIRVEEYKRPTFTVESEQPEEAYALGDSIEVSGKAMTYTGVPLANAKVNYTVERRGWWRWGDEEMEPQTGETLTSADGSFTLPVVLTPPTKKQLDAPLCRYTFEVKYTVTADNGETQEGTAFIQTASEPAFYEVEMPKTICREHLPEIQLALRNAAGKTIGEEVTYYVENEAGEKLIAEKAKNGEAFRWDETYKLLPSGVYHLVLPAQEGAKEKRERFVIFGETDTQPADRTEKFFAYTRPTDRTDSAFVLIGTPESKATIFYDLVCADRVIESREIHLSDSLISFTVDYRPEMGDGATMCFAMVRDGQCYQHTVKVEKPKPEKRLVMEWESFRSLLEPGQEEEWTLRISYPDGRPAPASILAYLYDASLDALAKVDNRFTSINFWRYLPEGLNKYYTTKLWGEQILDWTKRWKQAQVTDVKWNQWKEHLYEYWGSGPYYGGLMTRMECLSDDCVALGAAPPMDYNASKSAHQKGMVRRVGKMAGSKNSVPREEKVSDTPMRSNFAETAFFLPQLRTDSTGRVNLSFRLPESLTRWHFQALAHTRAMDYAQLDTMVVARKTLMAEANLPRFIRKGDRTRLPVKVTNLGDKTMKVKLNVKLDEWQTAGEVLVDKRLEMELAAKESKVIEIPYECQTKAEALRFRVTAQGEQFSDGEERLLPVLSDEVEVTRTLPFTLLEEGTHQVDLAPLHKGYRTQPHALAVELTSNPTWYAVAALPVLANHPLSISATEWATQFYALALGEKLLALNPSIRQWAETTDEELEALAQRAAQGLDDTTPWAQKGEQLRQRSRTLTHFFDPSKAAGLRRTAIDKLQQLQQPDGAWSWCPGMAGNAYITVEVAILLSRVQRLAENFEASKMLEKAMTSLRKHIAREVEDMKKEEKRTKKLAEPTEVQLKYLYLRTLQGLRPDKDAQFLLERAAKLRHDLTMYGKAVAAVVLSETGYEEEARLQVDGLMEHTVSSPDKGRWFDTERAQSGWSCYRIPTQCATIEALAYFGRETEADEMRRWLLQAKRTQVWETSQATADAVYALLSTAGRSYSVTALDAAPLTYSLTKGKRTVAKSQPMDSETPKSVGYVKRVWTDKATLDAEQLEVVKPQVGTAWGCVYAAYRLPAEEVLTEGKDLYVKRRWEIWREGKWQRLSTKERVKRGDRLRQVYSVRADRDFDFVSLNASRAACLEPVQALSGYRWDSGLAIYRAVRDAATDFFIEHLPKGDHEFSEELFVVRSGHYTTGIARTQSVFAPEFGGTTKTDELNVE